MAGADSDHYVTLRRRWQLHFAISSFFSRRLSIMCVDRVAHTHIIHNEQMRAFIALSHYYGLCCERSVAICILMYVESRFFCSRFFIQLSRWGITCSNLSSRKGNMLSEFTEENITKYKQFQIRKNKLCDSATNIWKHPLNIISKLVLKYYALFAFLLHKPSKSFSIVTATYRYQFLIVTWAQIVYQSILK